MPNKITDEEVKAARDAFSQFYPLDISDGIMRTVLEAYESAKWRPGAPTEDGNYHGILKGDNRLVIFGTVVGCHMFDDNEAIKPSDIVWHRPFPKPPREGE